MLHQHTETIRQNLVNLVAATDVALLTPWLLHHRVFPEHILNRILHSEIPGEEDQLQKVALYLGVCKRGPLAFHRLIKALNDSGHQQLASMLNTSESTKTAPKGSHPFLLPGYLADDQSPSGSYTTVPSNQITHALQQFAATTVHDISDEDDEKKEVVVRVRVRDALRMRLPDGRPPDVYTMTRNPRGHALLINNVEFADDKEHKRRNGSENDVTAMTQLLEQLYFNVEPYVNQTRQQMYKRVSDFAARDDWTDLQCCVVVLMSHGIDGVSDDDTELLGTDGLGLKVRDVLALFRHNVCPALRNKPKLFIMQSCRGALVDPGVLVVNPSNVDGIDPHRIETDGRMMGKHYATGSSASGMVVWDRSDGDIFVVHPVPPGIRANRDKYTGAWFIQTLCQVFAEFANEYDVEDLLKIVDQRIKGLISVSDRNYQTLSTSTRGWNKRLFFNPGLHIDPSTKNLVTRSQYQQQLQDMCNSRSKDTVDGDGCNDNNKMKQKKCSKDSKYKRLENSTTASHSIVSSESSSSLGSTSEVRNGFRINNCWPC